MDVSSIWDLDEFKPYASAWSSRQQELQRRHDYYSGAVYEQHKYRFGWWLGNRLYRGIRPLFLPFARAVDVDAGIIPGGWDWAQDAPDGWRDARKQVFDWSEWATRGVLYVHYGAIYGVSGLKVSDLRDSARIEISPVSPRKFMLAGGMSLFVEERTGPDGKAFEYAEVITPETIRLFADGRPFEQPGQPALYANALGQVPYIEVRHIETGEVLGDCTFQKAMRILDELNELGSHLADIIKKYADPQTVITGADKGDLTKGNNAWFLPEGAKVDMILAAIDIPGVQGFLTQLYDNVNSALPETAFDELKSKAEIATATLELQLQELVLKVQRCRPNYDAGLVKALRMAGQAAAGMGLSEITALDDEALALDNERSVLRADLDTREKLDYLIQTGAPNEKLWEMIGIQTEEIAEWKRLKDEAAAKFAAQLDNDPDEDEAAPQKPPVPPKQEAKA